MNKARFRNYGLWVAVAALLPMILQSFGLNVLPSNFSSIINSILGIFVMLGILNNPTTNCKWFSDDEKKQMEKNKEDSSC